MPEIPFEIPTVATLKGQGRGAGNPFLGWMCRVI